MSALTQNKILIAAAVVAVVGVGAALYSIRRAVPAQPRYELPKVESAPRIQREEAELASQPRDVAAAVLGRALEARLAPGYDAELLSRTVLSTVEMYLAGSIEAYEAWLQSEGLAPPAGWTENRGRHRKSIEMGFATLRDAPMESDSVLVRPFPLPGEQDTDADRINSRAVSAQRLDRSLSDESGRRAAEVVIPAQVNALGVGRLDDPSDIGPPVRVDARLGLIYHWSPEQGKWILVELRIYDVPQGAFVVLPSL